MDYRPEEPEVDNPFRKLNNSPNEREKERLHYDYC